MRTTRVAGLLALALAATGCVEAAPGAPLSVRATGAAPYVVRTILPGEAVPAADRVGGSVDALTGGRVVSVAGWVPAESGELVVVGDQPLVVLSQRRLLRPDAAAALGDPSHPALGFRLVLRSQGGPSERICVLARTPLDAPVTRLAQSDPTLCPVP